MEAHSAVRGPQARAERIVARDFGDELLVYDLDAHTAHCLNRTAALVWRACDGHTHVAAIAAALSEELGTTVDERVVWYALEQLHRDGLLTDPVDVPHAVTGISRKDAVRRLGVAAAVLAVPAVTSIVAPRAAEAATCLASGSVCTSSAQCCSGVCNTGTCL